MQGTRAASLSRHLKASKFLIGKGDYTAAKAQLGKMEFSQPPGANLSYVLTVILLDCLLTCHVLHAADCNDQEALLLKECLRCSICVESVLRHNNTVIQQTTVFLGNFPHTVEILVTRGLACLKEDRYCTPRQPLCCMLCALTFCLLETFTPPATVPVLALDKTLWV